MVYESYLGATLMAWPPLAALSLWIASLGRELKRLKRVEEAKEALLSLRWTSLLGLGLGAASTAFIYLDFQSSEPMGPSIYGFSFRWVLCAGAVIAFGFGIDGLRRSSDGPHRVSETTARLLLAAVGLTWMVVSYFPHSNIPVLLPTVRAERFWYFPVIGTSMMLAVFMIGVHRFALRRWADRGGLWASVFIVAFMMFQATQARIHALDYRDDLTFWEATKDAVPRSAKAHLNFSVMKGARGDLETRLKHSKIAIELSPEWPMAHIYTGDTLCRMNRADEAWPFYREGFSKGKNEIGLIALALQCLWDKGGLLPREAELRALAEELTGSWFAYLAIDTINNGEKHKGVDPQYRPRGYNEGPKEKKEESEETETETTSEPSASDAKSL